ncbi:MAG: hypothetical protein QM504_08585 [Pseudomonadota bacterium]
MKSLNGLIGVILVALLFATSALAGNARYTMGASLTNYDNIKLVPDPLDSELAKSIIGTAQLTEDDVNLLLNLTARLQVIKYTNGQAEDRNRSQLVADTLWKIRPEHFEWYLADTFSQTAIDSFSAAAPSNEQNANVLITGPNYILRINSRNNLRFEARIANNSYDNTADNSQLKGASRWLYDINSALRMSVNYESTKVKYDKDTNILNYNRSDAFFSLDYKKGLILYKIETGTTKIDYDRIGGTDVPRYLFAIESQRTRTSSLKLNLSRKLTDTASQLTYSSAVDLVNNPLLTTSNDTFVKDSVNLDFTEKTTFGNYWLSLNHTEDSYTIRKTLDRDINSISFVNTWSLRRSSNLAFKAYYFNTKYADPTLDREDKDYRYSLYYNYRAKRSLNLRFGVESIKRESTVVDQGYENLLILIGLEHIFQ